MDEEFIRSVIKDLNASSDDILVSMLISVDGFPMCFEGVAADMDLKGALYTELALLARRISAELGSGEIEEVFVRSRSGCVVVWPVGDIAFLACMAKANIDTHRMQMLAWKAVSRLRIGL